METMDKMKWPTKDEIHQTNIKVVELQTKMNSIDTYALHSTWEQLFNEAMSINPNHVSCEYADNLMKIKYKLYEKIKKINL